MIYRANILFTPTPEAFSVLERGYIAVAEDGTIEGVFETLPAQYAGAEVRDF